MCADVGGVMYNVCRCGQCHVQCVQMWAMSWCHMCFCLKYVMIVVVRFMFCLVCDVILCVTSFYVYSSFVIVIVVCFIKKWSVFVG